jgi:hypothetical protein
MTPASPVFRSAIVVGVASMVSPWVTGSGLFP